MKRLREPQVRAEIACTCVLTVCATGIAWLQAGRTAALVTASLGVLLFGVHMVFLCRRYRALAALGNSIDRILHGQDKLLFADSEEGELAILRSEIRKMVIRLQQNAQQLQDAKQLLAVEMEDISHQLRTPLTTLNLTVSLLQEPDLTTEKRLRLTHECRTALARMDWLVEAFLKLSRLDAGVVQFAAEDLAVRDVVRAALMQLAIPMELREQTVTAEVGEEHFRGDAAWCTEALGNLLKNCMEHTPVGGHIWVKAEENSLYTELTIRDSGDGFDKEDLPHLFERFYRGKNATASSIGIGLALARRVVTAQNGSLTASNHPNGGALFTLRFYKSVI